MGITAVCRMLVSCSHWVIHSVWLAALAVAICANVIFDYFQIQAADMRLLLSENSIAANVVRAELGCITTLLDSAEGLAAEPHGRGLLAEHLSSVARRVPFISFLAISGDNSTAVVGEPSPAGATDTVFTRAIPMSGRAPLTVRLMLSSDFWAQRLAAVFSATDARVALYTASGRALLPFDNMSEGEAQALVAAVQGMSGDAASLNVSSVTLGATSRKLVLRQVAAPFVEEGPLVVGTVLTASHARTHWRGNVLIEVLAWVAAAVVSTWLLMLEARSRQRSEISAERMHEDVRTRDKFISVLMEHAPIMVSYWDVQSKCRYANKVYRGWFGRSKEQMEGLAVQDLLGPKLYEECAPLIAATLRGEPQQFEQKRARADGSVGYVLSRYIPDMDGLEVRGFFVIASDITELKQTQFKLEKRIEDLYSMATIDALTGLNNRRNLLEKVQLEIERARRYDMSVGFLMLDIDHFKDINDTYGHDAGDNVLQRVGTMLRETMRASDHVGRLGGEEFGILLTNVSAELTHVIAERLRKKMAALIVPYMNTNISFTVSIGVADLLLDTDNPLESMMTRADMALYRAKNAGRNRVCLADNLLEPMPVA